jgi:hypothetical protein
MPVYFRQQTSKLNPTACAATHRRAEGSQLVSMYRPIGTMPTTRAPPSAPDTSYFGLGPGWFGFSYRTLVQMKWYWNGSVVQTVNAWNDVHTQQFWTASGSWYQGVSGSWCTVPVSA